MALMKCDLYNTKVCQLHTIRTNSCWSDFDMFSIGFLLSVIHKCIQGNVEAFNTHCYINIWMPYCHRIIYLIYVC